MSSINFFNLIFFLIILISIKEIDCYLKKLNDHNVTVAVLNDQENVQNTIILKEINEGLKILQNRDEEKLKKLNNLELRLNQLESTNQHQNDILRGEIESLSTSIKQFGWMIQKMDLTFEKIQKELEIVTKSHEIEEEPIEDEFKTQKTIKKSLDLDEKLDSLASLLASTRAGVHRLEKNLQTNTDNIAIIMNSNKKFIQLQKNYPTKQFINSAINNLKTQQISNSSGNRNSYLLNDSPSPVSNHNQNHHHNHHPNHHRKNVIITSNNSSRNNLNQNRDVFKDSPSSCYDVQVKNSGVYKISLPGSILEPFYVFCEMEEFYGNWMVIQSRTDGRLNFYRNWLEYKNGFGNIAGEFWIGLEKLHEITYYKPHEILISLEDLNGIKKYAKYSLFAVGSERDGFPLSMLGSYSGNAGDSLSYHAGRKFSTFDVDNDEWAEGSCAQAHTGAWWYSACDTSNLNGRYLNGEVPNELLYSGIYWNDFHGKNYSLKSVKIMIRRVK